MHKILIILSVICSASLQLYSQVRIYKLADKTLNADIDYNKLNLLNRLPSGYFLLNKVFKPKSGKYTVYRFLATFKGMSHVTENPKTCHDLVIIKTDNSNKIVDAYQYTLEWAEEPFTTDLYQYTAKGLTLKNLLTLKDFHFKQVPDYSDKLFRPETLPDQGYLEF